jgi:hypothetical protein
MQEAPMTLRILLFILLILSLVGTPGNAAECTRGTRTSLQFTRIDVPLIPRHGKTLGRTSLVLRSEPGGEILLDKEVEGNWFCVGFNRRSKTYIVGGMLERGAWLPLCSMQYLREDGSSLEPSAFDRLGYLAMTALASPGGRYIAFIGGRNTTGTLCVLDTERDLVRKLGQAPAPPHNAFESDTCSGEPFRWGTCWGDGYVEMDAGIVRFKSEHVLEVSYGDDSPHGRAKKRRVKRFTLG